MERIGDRLESLPELLQLPESSYTVFERPPLVLALCQVRFTRVLGVADPKFVAPFQRAIQDAYPVLTQQQKMQVRFGGAVGEAAVQEEPTFSWKFGDGEDNWTLVLAQDFLALETRAYKHFDDFVNRLSNALGALMTHIQPARWTRLGLRYIDEIRPDHGSCLDAIRAELLGPLALSGLTGEAEKVQAIQQISLSFSGGLGLTISHGLLPDGSTVQQKGEEVPPTGPFYLLDTDAFREAREPAGERFDRLEISDEVRLLNQACYKLFRWSITDDYAATLGEKQHAD